MPLKGLHPDGRFMVDEAKEVPNRKLNSPNQCIPSKLTVYVIVYACLLASSWRYCLGL